MDNPAFIKDLESDIGEFTIFELMQKLIVKIILYYFQIKEQIYDQINKC